MTSNAAQRPIRLSTNLVNIAEAEAKRQKRSIAGQVEYWATIGKAVESLPGFTLERVQAALDGNFDVDTLTFAERAYFDEALGGVLAKPSANEAAFYAELERDGGGVGYDDAGNLVRALPGGGTEVISAARG